MAKVNYRKLYFQHYQIDDPGADFAIHHIDFNRANNDIGNLIMLPSKLHSQYHFCVNALRHGDDKTKLSIDCMIDLYGSTYDRMMLRHYVEVLDEIEKWRQIKVNADYAIYMAKNCK